MMLVPREKRSLSLRGSADLRVRNYEARPVWGTDFIGNRETSIIFVTFSDPAIPDATPHAENACFTGLQVEVCGRISHVVGV